MQRLRAGPAHPRAVQGRAGRRPAGDDRRDQLLRHGQQPVRPEQGNPGGRHRTRHPRDRLHRQAPAPRISPHPLQRAAWRAAHVTGGVPLSAGQARAGRQQAHRSAGRQRAAHHPRRRHLPGARHCPLRAAGQAGGSPAGRPRAGHHSAGQPGNPRSGQHRQPLRRADVRDAQGQGPDARRCPRAAEGHRGPRHHDAGAGRSRRPGFRCRAHHRQHHSPGPAADQDRPGLQPGVFGVLHAATGSGAGLWRLRGKPEPERHRTGRDRSAERRVRRGAGRQSARGDDQLLHRQLRQRCGSREGRRSHPHRSGACTGPADRRPPAVRRRFRAQRRPAEGAEQQGGRPGHGVHLP